MIRTKELPEYNKYTLQFMFTINGKIS